jgi:hypothetical protein
VAQARNSLLTHQEQASDAHDERCNSWARRLRVVCRHFVEGERKRLRYFGLLVLDSGVLVLSAGTVSFFDDGIHTLDRGSLPGEHRLFALGDKDQCLVK